jgi:glycerol-3-phosphate dehydrogenase (NAD(P)+)
MVVMAADPPKVAVIGSGSWGTAFATITAEKGIDTVLWARRQELAGAISERHENPDYLAGVELPPSLRATTDLEECLSGATCAVMAIPSQSFRSIFREATPLLGADVPVVSLVKGIEQGTDLRMTEVMQQEGLREDLACVLTGPNLAKEIARRAPAATVVACTDGGRAQALQALFMAPYFRVYTNPDVVGCEMAGAMKNVIAIAAGIADGMAFGDNAKASLLTRGLAELARLGARLGGNPLTFAGLAGMGDLIATCVSKLSRNRFVGEELGKGRKLDDIVAEMNMVAEGVKSSRPLCDLARRNDVEVPIAEHVVKVLYEGVEPAEMVASLMLRQAKPELYGLER